MKIYVCVKHVPDTAAKITILEKNRIDERVTFIINPYDENAIEEALRLKKRVDDSEVIAVTLGKEAAEATLRAALAMGADRGILIKTDDDPDEIVTAKALKAVIATDGKPDIIFTGKVSVDSEGFQTMYRLAANFGMPAASNVATFSMEGDRVIVESELEAGTRQIIAMPLPCVIGAGKSLNQPSYPTLPAIMRARKKEVKVIDLAGLTIEKSAGKVAVLELKPAVESRKAREIKGTPEAVAGDIVRILRDEAKVIS